VQLIGPGSRRRIFPPQSGLAWLHDGLLDHGPVLFGEAFLDGAIQHGIHDDLLQRLVCDDLEQAYALPVERGSLYI
jgi:hypothetical protein